MRICSIVPVLLLAALIPFTTQAAPPPGLKRQELLTRLKLPKPAIPRAVDPAELTLGNLPRQFAVAIPTKINAAAGTWEQLADGRSVLRAGIESSGAKSLNLTFEHLRLPSSASLYVHGNGDSVRGPFTARHVRGGKLWTPVVDGEVAVVEVVVDSTQRDEVEFEISRVGYGYVSLHGSLMGKAGACQVDVACDAAQDWQKESRAVAVYTFGGEFSCSATLMNNTARDQTPYLLTAAHCITTAEEAASTVVYWQFQASACGAQDGMLEYSQAGADLVARSPDWFHSDFALLKLWEKPDPRFNVYYAGWDRRDVAPRDVAVIHHPSGDEKKFGRSDVPTSIVSAYGKPAENDHPWKLPAYVRVESWEVGALEYGSSGSGLWNSDRRIVGHASTATAYCDNQKSWSLFGALKYDWDGLPDEDESLAAHLDPVGTGEAYIDGLDPFAPVPTASPVAAAASGGGGGGGGALSLVQLAILCLMLVARRRRAA